MTKSTSFCHEFVHRNSMAGITRFRGEVLLTVPCFVESFSFRGGLMVHENLNPDGQVAAGRGSGGPRPGPRSTAREDFIQHQLFAVLALKSFLKTDYRGVAQHLADFAELRGDLGLTWFRTTRPCATPPDGG